MAKLLMTEEDLKWRARRDAESLAEASVIKKDPERIKRAKSAAVEMVKEREESLSERREELNGLKNLAGMPVTTKKSDAENIKNFKTLTTVNG